MTGHHTPTPWETKEGEIYAPNDLSGRTIARIGTSNPQAAEDAAFIVKACNGYEELRDLIEDLWDKTSDYLFANSGDYYEYKARVEAIHNADKGE